MNADLSKFVCRRCGACCRIEGIVRLKDADVTRIAAHLGMCEEDFIANETNLAPNRQGLVLKDRPDGACAMLDGQNRCRIYPVRPEKCRTFPYEWTNDESSAYCPALCTTCDADRVIEKGHGCHKEKSQVVLSPKTFVTTQMQYEDVPNTNPLPSRGCTTSALSWVSGE